MILLYWLPRSGGTFIYQVLWRIFKRDSINTTHDFLATNKKVVVVYRDFRSAALSAWKIHNKEMPKWDDIIGIVRSTIPKIDILNKYRKVYPNALFLRYENFFNNYSYLFTAIESYFNITIPDSLRNRIISETNLKHNKKLANNIKITTTVPFESWDRKTWLHHGHINTGTIDSWKELPKNLQIVLTSGLKKQLIDWGYDTTD